ncbi:ICOS ligand-like isoform X1 [Coregonus clupeaformis]|uniref:ICOS ligand-like isoform X1 n=1 Tax=Coregonus clupeaformis TaxID=59861 RepID=UPI001BE06251|nr:ICOS ligand-like isoform X1 [Coregonus clupeaformis]
METYRTHFVMWTVLGLTAVFISASAQSDVQAIVEQKVLLQCPCVKRNEKMNIYWQLEEHTTVLYHDGSHNNTTIGNGYENRVRLFLNEDKDNCSLLLSGITVADNGVYKCSYTANAYVYKNVILHVAASYSVYMDLVSDQASACSGGGEGSGVYQCKASGGYPEGQIHWELDGHPLVNPSRRDVTHLDNFTGLYSLTSNLTIELNKGEKLQCVVENTALASNLTSNSSCNQKLVSMGTSSPDKVVVAGVVAVSLVVMFIVGVPLVFLLTRCCRHERSTKQRDTERQERGETQSLNAYENDSARMCGASPPSDATISLQLTDNKMEG